MDKTLGIVLLVYALVLWIILLFVWRKGFREWRANCANRPRKFSAKVVGKRERPGAREAEETESAPEYLVTFEFGGRQGEFVVEPATYAAARIGQEGTVYLRGQRFEFFDPKSEAEEAEDVYRRMVKD